MEEHYLRTVGGPVTPEPAAAARFIFGPFRPGDLVRGVVVSGVNQSGTPAVTDALGVDIRRFGNRPPDTPEGFNAGDSFTHALDGTAAGNPNSFIIPSDGSGNAFQATIPIHFRATRSRRWLGISVSYSSSATDASVCFALDFVPAKIEDRG